MDRLKRVLLETLESYIGEAINGYSYLTESRDGDAFTIVSVGQIQDKRIVDAGLIVRIQGERIIIERDVNNKHLVDALLQANLPRDQIVLAYAGEPVEEPML